MAWVVFHLLVVCSLTCGKQSFLNPDSQSFTIPLKAMSMNPAKKLELITLLTTHHKSLRESHTSPVFLQTESAATVILRNYFNTQFAGSVGIGTPPQYLDVILDTGSANFWINSKMCTDRMCLEQDRYDHDKSSTFEELGYFVEVQFGTGEVNGEINEDTVELAGIRIPKQRFGEITEMEGDVFEDAQFAGILGLGFPKMAAFGFEPVFDGIMRKNVISKNIFTFYYSLDDHEQSEMTIGAIDKSKYEGDITWVDIVEGMEYYWLIPIEDIRIGDLDLGLCKKGCKAAVDTGTTLLAAPSDSSSKMLFTLNLDENCKSYRKLPDLIIQISGREFHIPPEDYILTMDEAGNEDNPGEHSKKIEDCTLGVMPMDIPKP